MLTDGILTSYVYIYWSEELNNDWKEEGLLYFYYYGLLTNFQLAFNR